MKQQLYEVGGEQQYKYGLYFGYEEKTVGTVLKNTWYTALDFARLVWMSLGDLVSGLVSVNDMSGPVGVVSAIAQTGQGAATTADGILNVLYLGAFIAINLAVMALRAGVDEDLGGKAYAQLIAAVKDGKLSEKEIDQACGRILRLKFEMGLFEHPYVDVKAAAEVGCADNAAVALDAARKLVTLLKNKDNTLPLRRDMRVAVVGPNADNVYNMLGDYTSPQPDGKVKTVLAGIKAKIGEGQVEYVKGCAVRDTNNCNIEALSRLSRMVKR